MNNPPRVTRMLSALLAAAMLATMAHTVQARGIVAATGTTTITGRAFACDYYDEVVVYSQTIKRCWTKIAPNCWSVQADIYGVIRQLKCTVIYTYIGNPGDANDIPALITAVDPGHDGIIDCVWGPDGPPR